MPGLGRGNRCKTGQVWTLRNFPSCRRKTSIITEIVQITIVLIPWKGSKHLGFLLPVSTVTALKPAPSSFFSQKSSYAGSSPWSYTLMQGSFFWRKGSPMASNPWAITLPCLALSVGAGRDFIIRGDHWGTYRNWASKLVNHCFQF